MADPPVRILIVDDEAAQTRALCDTLSTCDYDTVGFTDGGMALDALRGSRFDILLGDLAMPGMDGISLLQEAQRIDPMMIGIIMTGEGTIATAVEAMRAGAFDYILKPFKLSAILPVLARAISVRSMRLENAALSRCVRERTEQLEAANRELEAFSYSVSHDLRAPLRSIDGFSRALLEDYAESLDGKGRDYLVRLQRSAQRMAELIADLISLSRVNRADLRRAASDLSGTARAIADDLQSEDMGRLASFDIADGMVVQGDGRLLRVLFDNLLGNAWKFTSKVPEARIEVGVTQIRGEQTYFVRDNGAGFEPTRAHKLFTPFQRLHSEADFPGTGIGLSIAQRIVVRHGGQLWAESEPDKGATFYFTLSG
jgi:two-component system sensor histidine kinase/response regulator